MICKTILYVSSCVYGETGMLALLRITNFCLELKLLFFQSLADCMDASDCFSAASLIEFLELLNFRS